MLFDLYSVWIKFFFLFIFPSYKGNTMAATVNLELDPIFLKALGFLHSKSKDSAEKLKALLDESLARGTDSSYRPSQKVLILDSMRCFYMPCKSSSYS